MLFLGFGFFFGFFFFFFRFAKAARAPARTSRSVFGWSTWPRPSTPFVDGFFSSARGPERIPARTEHAPLVSSPRDHHDSHHAPSEPRRYVRAARPRLASLPINARRRSRPPTGAFDRLRKSDRARSHDATARHCRSVRATPASLSSSDPPASIFPSLLDIS